MTPVIIMHRIARAIIGSAGFLLIASAPALSQTNTSPSLKVITPSEGQTIYGQKVPVLIAVDNFSIIDYQIEKSAAPGIGHVHLWLDDANPTRDSAVKLTTDEFTFSDVPYGNHTLRAELVTSTHQSQNPPVVSIIKFKSAAISSPSPVTTSGFDKRTALVILVIVALVIVAAWWYTKEDDEEEMPKSKSKVTKRGVKKRK